MIDEKIDQEARLLIVYSILYYSLNISAVSDEEFDRMAKHVSENFDKIRQDQQKALGSAEEIASTGYHIKFSKRSIFATVHWLRNNGYMQDNEYLAVSNLDVKTYFSLMDVKGIMKM